VPKDPNGNWMGLLLQLDCGWCPQNLAVLARNGPRAKQFESLLCCMSAQYDNMRAFQAKAVSVKTFVSH
jgi:hypothetical protein